MSKYFTDPQEVVDCINNNAGEIAIMEVTEKGTGEKVNVIVVAITTDKGTNIYPLAEMFRSNPFDRFETPEDMVEMDDSKSKH